MAVSFFKRIFGKKGNNGYNENMNKLPDKLLQLRKHYGYSQSFVADYLAISTLDYMGYENGRTVPNFEQLKLLAKLFKVRTTELFDNNCDLELTLQHKITVDQENSAYLNKQAKAQSRKRFFSQNGPKLILIAILVLTIGLLSFGIFSWLKTQNTPLIQQMDSPLNRFAASDFMTVYIDNSGTVNGQGDNSAGQLDGIRLKGAFKVAAGRKFTAILLRDGTVEIAGEFPDAARKEVNAWKRIVDIAAGNDHLVALTDRMQVLIAGDNTEGQCDLAKEEAKQIFALGNGTVILTKEGKVKYCGDFVGKAQIKYAENILSLVGNDALLAYLTADNRVVVHALYGDFDDCEKWENVIDIAVGKEFVAALTKEGHILISTVNELLRAQVTTFHDTLAIAGGIDYLAAYNGQEVLGAGKNTYKQFKDNPIQKLKLPQVKNVIVKKENDHLNIVFDPILHAVGYELHLDEMILKAPINEFKVALKDLKDNHEYNLEIMAVGEDIYESSEAFKSTYLYTADEGGTGPDDLVEIDRKSVV